LKYELQIERSAQKSLAKISEPFQTKIIGKIKKLSDDPYQDSKKLTARDAYRIRIGNYRVIFEIHNHELVVLIIAIGHRKDIYTK
jgi:mRNA interferase RelE/StbE